MRWSVLPVMALSTVTVLAQGRGGKGQGAIVIRDDAPVYVHSRGTEVEWKLKRGDAVAGTTSDLMPKWLFDEVAGRLHVVYFQGEQKGLSRSGWMDPKDLSRFTYDGACQVGGSPLTTKGFSTRWNACFEEARRPSAASNRPRRPRLRRRRLPGRALPPFSLGTLSVQVFPSNQSHSRARAPFGRVAVSRRHSQKSRAREFAIEGSLRRVFERRLKARRLGCPFVFHQVFVRFRSRRRLSTLGGSWKAPSWVPLNWLFARFGGWPSSRLGPSRS